MSSLKYRISPLFGIFILLLSLAGCCDESQVSANLKKLYSRSPSDRNDAALALARCDTPESHKAVRRLGDLLYDSNVGVQSSAAYALRKIDTPEARQILEKAVARRDRKK